MRLPGSPLLLLLLSFPVKGLCNPIQQVAFNQQATGIVEKWDLYAHPPPDSTSRFIFDNVNSLMDHWPNAYYQNGHTIVPAIITPGTLLYHGRAIATPPTTPDWFSFDAEHALLFAQWGASARFFTYVSTRELKLLYFDGSSAAKMHGGSMDSQSAMTHGNFTEEDVRNEFGRLLKLCDWGKEFGIDGFIRMEFDFEVMYCDFTNGVKLVSNLDLVKGNLGRVRRPPPPESTQVGGAFDALFRPKLPIHTADKPVPTTLPPGFPGGPNPPVPAKPPKGWKGSLRAPQSFAFEAIQAGNWHNFRQVPGVRVDHSKLITFYDPRYTSLVKARRGLDRFHHRLWNISNDDLELVHDDIRHVLSRDEKGSGVQWGDVTRSVINRYAQRLEFLGRLAGGELTAGNVTEAVVQVRKQVLMMLNPYLLHSAAVPSPENSYGYGGNVSWIAPSLEHCATVFTSHISEELLLTSQELLIKEAVEDIVHEICRVLGVLWVSAYDSEELSTERQTVLLTEWKAEVEGLKAWLGWSIWVSCSPGCGVDEMCTPPQWPFDRKRLEEGNYQPRCVSRLRLDIL